MNFMEDGKIMENQRYAEELETSLHLVLIWTATVTITRVRWDLRTNSNQSPPLLAAQARKCKGLRSNKESSSKKHKFLLICITHDDSKRRTRHNPSSKRSGWRLLCSPCLYAEYKTKPLKVPTEGGVCTKKMEQFFMVCHNLYFPVGLQLFYIYIIYIYIYLFYLF